MALVPLQGTEGTTAIARDRDKLESGKAGIDFRALPEPTCQPKLRTLEPEAGRFVALQLSHGCKEPIRPFMME